VEVPSDLRGGELILRSPKRQVGKIAPQSNTLLYFQGDLTHSVNAVSSSGMRLSLVCEQYSLEDDQLEEIPPFEIESRVKKVERQKKKPGKARSLK
jgi:predicted 2-oxoglutarate/Fe(II)-dependent dioxygenase YbiX